MLFRDCTTEVSIYRLTEWAYTGLLKQIYSPSPTVEPTSEGKMWVYFHKFACLALANSFHIQTVSPARSVVLNATFHEESAPGNESGEVFFDDLLKGRDNLPLTLGSMTITGVHESGNHFYINATQSATKTSRSARDGKQCGLCQASISTACSAISIVKYKTRSCAGATRTSGCSAWAIDTSRGYSWCKDSAILFTSWCSADVLNSYRTLSMVKYEDGIREAVYSVAKRTTGRFTYTLAVTCT